MDGFSWLAYVLVRQGEYQAVSGLDVRDSTAFS
jgi:hypothetical protein